MRTRFVLMLIAITLGMFAWTWAIPALRSSKAAAGPNATTVKQIAFSDLVITSIRVTGRPKVTGGSARVPITVVVKKIKATPQPLNSK